MDKLKALKAILAESIYWKCDACIRKNIENKKKSSSITKLGHCLTFKTIIGLNHEMQRELDKAGDQFAPAYAARDAIRYEKISKLIAENSEGIKSTKAFEDAKKLWSSQQNDEMAFSQLRYTLIRSGKPMRAIKRELMSQKRDK